MEEENGNCLWTLPLVKLSTLRFKCVVKVTGAEVGQPVTPGGSEKLMRMSERCNLKTLTAALCCFYHKNSVITAKVRDGGVCVCVCEDAHVVYDSVLCISVCMTSNVQAVVFTLCCYACYALLYLRVSTMFV